MLNCLQLVALISVALAALADFEFEKPLMLDRCSELLALIARRSPPSVSALHSPCAHNWQKGPLHPESEAARILNSARAFIAHHPCLQEICCYQGPTPSSTVDGSRQHMRARSATVVGWLRYVAPLSVKIKYNRMSLFSILHKYAVVHFTPTPGQMQKIRASEHEMTARERECRLPSVGGSR